VLLVLWRDATQLEELAPHLGPDPLLLTARGCEETPLTASRPPRPGGPRSCVTTYTISSLSASIGERAVASSARRERRSASGEAHGLPSGLLPHAIACSSSAAACGTEEGRGESGGRERGGKEEEERGGGGGGERERGEERRQKTTGRRDQAPASSPKAS